MIWRCGFLCHGTQGFIRCRVYENRRRVDSRWDRRQVARPPAWRVQGNHERMVVVIPNRRRGGAHGRTRGQQEIRLRDEARRCARPSGTWDEQAGGHGTLRHRQPDVSETVVPGLSSRRAGGAAPEAQGQAEGREIQPKPAPTREQLLEEENAYLKARVAYLEKARALLASKPTTGRSR